MDAIGKNDMETILAKVDSLGDDGLKLMELTMEALSTGIDAATSDHLGEGRTRIATVSFTTAYFALGKIMSAKRHLLLEAIHR